MTAATSAIEGFPFTRSTRRRSSPQRLSDADLQARVRIAASSPLISEFRQHRWLAQTIARLQDLRELGPDWDGHGGRAVAPDAMNFALRLLQEIMLEDSPAPAVVPLSYGGIQLEWHQNDIDLEIAVHGPNDISSRYFDHRTNALLETDIAAAFSELIEPIRKLTAHRR